MSARPLCFLKAARFFDQDPLDIAGYDNLDYVRKMRNQSLRVLTDALEPHRIARGEVIAHRRASDDRRRVEYALGIAVHVVIEE